MECKLLFILICIHFNTLAKKFFTIQCYKIFFPKIYSFLVSYLGF